MGNQVYTFTQSLKFIFSKLRSMISLMVKRGEGYHVFKRLNSLYISLTARINEKHSLDI